MGWGNHHDDHIPEPGRGQRLDPSTEGAQETITAYIRQRLGGTANVRCDFKDVAGEVSVKFGVVLTPGEVKDIERSGW